MSEQETVEVTVKVPKRLMQLIEKAKFFGWNKEAFFKVCVKCGVSSCLGDMEINEMNKLTKNYNGELWTVYPEDKPHA